MPIQGFSKESLINSGRNGAGPVGLGGADVGDIVVLVMGFTEAQGSVASIVPVAKDSFEKVVTVANQIQQLSAVNLSGNQYAFYLAKV